EKVLEHMRIVIFDTGIKGCLMFVRSMLFIFLSFWFFSGHSQAEVTYKTESLELGCGFADEVWDYVVETLGKRKAIGQFPKLGSQGERRRFVLYPDSSWFLTLEIPHLDPSLDISCIVAKGDQTTAYDAME